MNTTTSVITAAVLVLAVPQTLLQAHAQDTPLPPETDQPLFALPFSDIVNDGSLMCNQEFYLNGDWGVPGPCSQLARRLSDERQARGFPENGPVGWRGGSCLRHTIEFSSDGSYFQQTTVPLDGGDINYEYSGTYALDSQQLRLTCETSVFFAGRDAVERSCVGFDPNESFYYLPPTDENSRVHGITTFGEYAGNDIRIYNPTNSRERIACSTSPITLQAAVEAASASVISVAPSDDDTVPAIDTNCDYTAAEFNNGWGWDQVTGESCPPLQTEEPVDTNCDYTDAALNDGWGWNPVEPASCPPQ